MGTEVVFESPNATIVVSPRKQNYSSQFHIPNQGETFREFMMLGTRILA